MIQVSEMAAGWEMDVLIAEKVMGQVPCDKWGMVIHPLMGLGAPTEHVKEHNCYPEQHGPAGYSTDIAAAWEVVEKMRQGCHAWEIDGDTAGWWVIADSVHSAEAPTAPLAICRAALLACGVTEIPE